LVRVVDSGPGIPAAEREQIFEPGYSTKPAETAGARGVGLSLVKGLVERRGRSIRVADAPDGGALVEVRLPAVMRADARGAPGGVVLSAAREMQSVRAAMQGGALHYLIKPFDFDDLRQRLAAYAELHAARSAERETHQQEVDRLFGLIRRPSGAAAIALPKGHSPATAELVLEALRESGEPLSASDGSERGGISRATAQRYLTSLADAGKARLNL